MATTRRQFMRDGAVAAGAALIASPAIVSSARAADAITVILPLGFAIDFFDAMNAAAGGHFANFGLDAKVIGANSGVQTVQLVASGQGTFGRGAPADIIRAVAANQNAPIAIASVFQGCPFRVFSLKTKPVLEPKDFAGKTVGLITLASPTGVYLDVMLAKAGLKPSDVERQATGGTPGAIEILKQGRVDCFISTNGVETALAQMHEPVEVWDPGKYLPLPGQTYYAMPDVLKARRDVAVRFLKACKASIDEMLAEPLASLITRAAKMFDIPGANNLDMSVAMVDDTIKNLLLADGRDKILVNLPERWNDGREGARSGAHRRYQGRVGALYERICRRRPEGVTQASGSASRCSAGAARASAAASASGAPRACGPARSACRRASWASADCGTKARPSPDRCRRGSCADRPAAHRLRTGGACRPARRGRV